MQSVTCGQGSTLESTGLMLRVKNTKTGYMRYRLIAMALSSLAK
jgi:hypothetical protein